MSSNLAAALILGASGATLIAVARMALENRRLNRERYALLTRQEKLLDQIERQAGGLMGSQDAQCPPGKTVSQGTVHAGGRSPSTPPTPAGVDDHHKRKGK